MKSPVTDTRGSTLTQPSHLQLSHHAFFLSRTGISKVVSWNHSENFEILNFYSAGLRGLSFPFFVSFCFLTKGYVMYGTL